MKVPMKQTHVGTWSLDMDCSHQTDVVKLTSHRIPLVVLVVIHAQFSVRGKKDRKRFFLMQRSTKCGSLGCWEIRFQSEFNKIVLLRLYDFR